MKIVLVLVVAMLLVFGYLYCQGRVSGNKAPPSLTGGQLSVCGSKPNCVSSMQDPHDDHFIQPITLYPSGSGKSPADSIDDVVAAITSLGGKISGNDGKTIQATFSSGIFKFVDDLQVTISNGKLEVRSSSRVGHSDMGANRKRVERLRDALS